MEPTVDNGSQPCQPKNIATGMTMCDHAIGKKLNENLNKCSPPLDDKLLDLVVFFTKNSYSAKYEKPEAKIILERCKELFEKDYNISTILNENGELSENYPSQIYIIEGLKTETKKEKKVNEAMQELIRQGHKARARTRFPVPVLYYQDKPICRSSTLAFYGEIYGRKGVDYLFQGAESKCDGHLNDVLNNAYELKNTNWEVVDKVQNADIILLQHIGVRTIFDLMVEHRKYKYCIPVSSSEKNSAERKYHVNFKIMSFPFPGCEFFEKFHSHNFTAEKLKFDWKQSMCDAELTKDLIYLPQINIDWTEYKNWDLIEITQNYVKYFLKYIKEMPSGILIHCISGWDRTPLFISLIRLSLWADGLAHTSLDEHEILYLTLAYDWMLFGHQLPDRIAKHEDILLFCFYFLKFIIPNDFSLVRTKKVSPLESVVEEANTSSDIDMKDDTDTDTSSPLMFHLSPQSVTTDEAESPTKNRPLSSLSSLEYPDNEPMDFNENNGAGGSRSSPIAVPGSQLSTDWSFVTGTGSVRSSDESSSVSSHSSTEGTNRKARLTIVRRLFYKHYFKIMSSELNYVTNEGMMTNIYRTALGYQPKLD